MPRSAPSSISNNGHAEICYTPTLTPQRSKSLHPSRHEGWPCPSEERCNAGKDYGLIARVPCAVDLRRFPPIPRATTEFERRYKGGTAVERVNARLKLFWGADDGNVTGARRFHANDACWGVCGYEKWP